MLLAADATSLTALQVANITTQAATVALSSRLSSVQSNVTALQQSAEDAGELLLQLQAANTFLAADTAGISCRLCFPLVQPHQFCRAAT